MSSPYEQEVARLHRFRTALRGATLPASADPIDQRIDAVCATIQANRHNTQAGTSLLNVRLSARDDINLNKTQLAQQIDELLQTLTPPADLVGELLDLYLPGHSREGRPVNAQTRRALPSTHKSFIPACWVTSAPWFSGTSPTTVLSAPNLKRGLTSTQPSRPWMTAMTP